MFVTRPCLRGWVGVHLCHVSDQPREAARTADCSPCGLESYLSLSTSHGDVDETASVCDSLLGATLGGLLLLLRLNLYASQISDLSGGL